MPDAIAVPSQNPNEGMRIYIVMARIKDKDDLTTILKYRVRARSQPEAEDAVKLRSGWPANGGVELARASESVQILSELASDDQIKAGYTLEAVERYLFQPDVLNAMIHDAIRTDPNVIEIMPQLDQGSMFGEVDVYRSAPIIMQIGHRSARGVRLVHISVNLGDSGSKADSVLVFNGGRWLAEGPWVAHVNDVLKNIERAALTTRLRENSEDTYDQPLDSSVQEALYAKARSAWNTKG